MRALILITFVCLVNANIYYDMSNESYEEVKESRNFTGKVVLVTGSSSGIGEGTVKLYSILGAKVVVTGRNETRIKAVAEECHKLSPHGLKPLEVVADLTKQDDAKRLVDSTIKEYGKLDILVNNAGSSVLSYIKDDKILEEFDKVFNIDVRSVVEMIHLSLPHLEKSKGTIINISSDAGLSPLVGMLTYQLAKSAINMMTKVLAIELGPSGIRVNTINPGFIDTPFADSTGIKIPDELKKKMFEKMADITPLKRIGQPLDIAKGIVFLSSTDAQFITGANLVIDGGEIYNSPADFLGSLLSSYY